jgi:hypothetical protein
MRSLPFVVLLAVLGLTACDPAFPAPPGPSGSSVLPSPPETSLSVGSSNTSVPGAGSCTIRQEEGHDLPDPACTPGTINATVTQAKLISTICKAHWTDTVRPSTSVTAKLKKRIDVAYGLPTTQKGELDHFVSLELGGAPLDVRNLWVEPGKIPNDKDAVEDQLHIAICSGLIPLVPAQQAIASDWPHALNVLGLVSVQGKVCLRSDPSRCASSRYGDETGE